MSENITRITEEHLKKGKLNELLNNEFGNTFIGKLSLLKSTIKDLDKESLSTCFSNTYQATSTCGNRETANPVGEIIEHLETFFNSDITALKTLLVIGCKGSGKSTLISYILKVALRKSSLANDIVCLKIDTQFSSQNDESIEKEVIRKINLELQQLISDEVIPDIYDKELLREVFYDEIKQYSALKPIDVDDDKLLNEIYPLFRTDEKLCVKKRLKYISNKFKLCIVFDNVDHSDSIETERDIFRVGKSLIQKLRCKYIISLRKPTYFAHYGTFGRDPNSVIVINPPMVEDILVKKISYLVDKGDISPTLKQGTVTINTAVFSQAAFHLFNEEVFTLLNHLCNGNVRAILKSFIEMLCSGHLPNDKFYQAVRKYSKDLALIEIQPIPRIYTHTCLPALIAPNQHLYVEEKGSLILNMYDNGIRSDKFNSVIRYRVLCVIESTTTFTENKGHQGGIEYTDLLNLLIDAGYSKEATENAILSLCEFLLIRTSTFSSPKKSEKLVITYSGTTYRNYLMFMSKYVQTMYPSTWVPQRKCITLPLKTFYKGRFNQIKKFVSYILEVEEYEKLMIKKDFFRNYIENHQLNKQLTSFHDNELKKIRESIIHG